MIAVFKGLAAVPAVPFARLVEAAVVTYPVFPPGEAVDGVYTTSSRSTIMWTIAAIAAIPSALLVEAGLYYKVAIAVGAIKRKGTNEVAMTVANPLTGARVTLRVRIAHAALRRAFHADKLHCRFCAPLFVWEPILPDGDVVVDIAVGDAVVVTIAPIRTYPPPRRYI